MSPDTQRLIDRLHKSARNAAAAKNPAQREAAIGFLVKRANELRAVRDAMDAKLGKQWDWLDAHLGDERYGSRELKALDLLHDYVAVCAALDEALIEWLDGREVAA